MRPLQTELKSRLHFDPENSDEEQNHIEIRHKGSGLVGAGDLHVSINGPTAEPDTEKIS
jgi:hypothetical protein